MNPELLGFLRRNFGPFFNADDGAGAGGGTDEGGKPETDDDEAAGGDDNDDLAPAAGTETDNAATFDQSTVFGTEQPSVDAIKHQQLQNELAAMRQELAAMRNANPGVTNQPKNTDDPFAGLTEEDFRNDPVLRANKAMYDRMHTSFEALDKRVGGVEERFDKAMETSNRRAAKQGAKQTAASIVNVMGQRDPMFRADDPAAKKRLERAQRDFDKYAADLADANYSPEQIEYELKQLYGNYRADLVDLIGYDPAHSQSNNNGQPANGQPGAKPTPPSPRDDALRRDANMRNSVSGGGAPPPTRDTVPHVSDDAAGLYEDMMRTFHNA